MLKVLKRGSAGDEVTKWQDFLRGQGYLIDSTGMFDDATVDATERFQRKHRLDVDGVVGNQTFGKAGLIGFEIVDYSLVEMSYPSRPTFPSLNDTAQRQNQFGPLEFVPAPTSTDPERIRITNGWAATNIVQITIPQLVGIKGANANGRVSVHRKVAEQFMALWVAWQDRGLLNLVLTYEGAYVPRFIRGRAKEQALSNHAFGTAFDINYAWNKLGAEPATAGPQGCVYPLVPVAHEFGFYWGGHFPRRDGMHFEVARLI